MGQYLIQFAAYTCAMVGIITLCLIVYKKTFIDVNINNKAEYLKVENSVNLSGRKTIYVIKAGDEKFLVASDIDKTTFLAKLDDKDATEKITNIANQVSFAKKEEHKPALAGIKIGEDLLPHKSSNVTKLPVMRELLRKLNS
ncbi:MAG: flagellar biosynthetic protein FliO [Candidatus Gastranaerophilales bacterium]|nr:flagellar biosynthetic protein FliO [Candidatus Gastranaerophilales bacterium]